jgi:hypothetical protein
MVGLRTKIIRSSCLWEFRHFMRWNLIRTHGWAYYLGAMRHEVDAWKTRLDLVSSRK